MSGPTSRTVAVLSYHKIGDPPPGGWPTWYYVPTAVFADHLAALRAAGWRAIDAAGFVRGLADPAALPERAVLLTFDDAYRSLVTDALPVLRRFDAPGVVFAPTALIGGRNEFDAGNEPDEPICGWDDLRVLDRAGVSVQSHGATHRAFSGLTPDERADEAGRSRRALEAGLGRPVELFAYPYGDPGPDHTAAAANLAAAGYRAGFLYKGGPTRWPAADPFNLPRVAVGPDTDLAAALGPHG